MSPVRRALGVLVAAFLAASFAPSAASRHVAHAASKPNVVVILTDDQRWDELDRMPVLQRELIDRGTVFTRSFVANPLCCPSRSTILTGRYSHSTGVYTNGGAHGGFPAFDDASTLATWLQAAGYRTGLVGKYLNHYTDASYIPPGWDEWHAFLGNPEYLGYTLSNDGARTSYGSTAEDYSTDVLAQLATRFVSSTPAGQPLFLFFTPYAPHVPARPAPRDAQAFPDFVGIRPPNLNEADVSDKPAWVRALPLSTETWDELRLRQYRALLSVDDAIGSIVAALDAAGRTGHTLFVYASDNGLSSMSHRWAGKQVPWEESIRVPLIVRYDPLAQAPKDGHLVLNVDYAPTIGALAGVRTPGAEGRSLVPLLKGKAVPWRGTILVEHFGRSVSVPSFCAVRTKTHMYARWQGGEEELYDLVADPYELQSLASDPTYARLKEKLHSRLARLCSPPPPGYTP
ncbi:MAG: sulfatase [Planctomycetaceae bacterium]